MTIVLDLPIELEQALAAEVEHLGLPLPDYALRLLTAHRPVQPMPTTGAELVDYWINEDILGSRSEIEDSQSHARLLRQRAEQRMREQ